MATKVYESGYITLIDDRQVYLIPLKIKYLREFMDYFELIKHAKSDDASIAILSYCALVVLRSQFPEIQTIEQLEDNIDLKNIYKALDIAAGIKINETSEEPVKKQASESKGTWDTLDLAELEAEIFLLGIWKDYEELETSLSMPELLATISSKRDSDYQEKKFLAAIQGVDLDKQSGKAESNAWEEMKARVFSGGQASDANDIVSFQGIKAQQAGFGVGAGLGYEDLRTK
jgi:hypothetical protein